MIRLQPPPHPVEVPAGWLGPSVPARPVVPRSRRSDVRHGLLLALSVAVVTAAAVLAGQLVTLNAASAYGRTDISATGPRLRDGENPLYAIREVLAGQSAALLRGDRDGYLRAIPVQQTDLRAQAGQR